MMGFCLLYIIQEDASSIEKILEKYLSQISTVVSHLQHLQTPVRHGEVSEASCFRTTLIGSFTLLRIFPPSCFSLFRRLFSEVSSFLFFSFQKTLFRSFTPSSFSLFRIFPPSSFSLFRIFLLLVFLFSEDSFQKFPSFLFFSFQNFPSFLLMTPTVTLDLDP